MSWENNVRRVEPYVPGEQPKTEQVIKLNTNECPYPPAPGVARAAKEMDTDALRLYPDPNASVLVDALADYCHVKPSQVFVGVGSDDVLSIAFLTFFNSGKPILFPDITYSFYDVWAEVYRIPYETVPLDENFQLRVEDYNRENGGIVIANPNAPTGLFMPVEQIENIIKNNPDSIVIVDEAYVDFGAESCLPLTEKYDNVLVVQTFSKSRAMAGARIGFALGSEKLIGYMNDVKFSINSYTMNRPSLVLGVEAVKDDAYFHGIVGKMIKTREWVKKELNLLGFTFPDSYSNFIFTKHKEKTAEELFTYLKSKNIYVRYFHKPRIDNYLRISIGTDEEMQALVDALKEYLGC